MEYERYMKSRPHVVILCAGASCAAIPKGHKNGKKISAMNGFIEKLGLNEIIAGINLKTNTGNLEDIYMKLDERSNFEPDCMAAKERLETEIYQYISDYRLPNYPTIYDYLVLSLTEKDLVVTFNWDLLLVQAYGRAMRYTKNLPQLAFLHGNVAVGFCEKDNVMGNVGSICCCGTPLKPTKLLFLIKNKDYTSDVAINKSWKTLENAMKVAYMITIFGYSVPKSDSAAIEILKQAWGKVEDRDFEEIEIVDIREEDEVIESWQDFIHTHHYLYHKSFFENTLSICPRRSYESTFDRLMMCSWLKPDKG